jgi:predicted  nucleic acid-binding Zn-ribbon protein
VKLDIIKGNNNEISNLNEKLTVNHKEKSELLEKLSEMNDCCMKLVTENEENVIEISRIKEKNRVIRNKLHEKVEYIQRLEESISKNYTLERGLF